MLFLSVLGTVAATIGIGVERLIVQIGNALALNGSRGAHAVRVFTRRGGVALAMEDGIRDIRSR